MQFNKTFIGDKEKAQNIEHRNKNVPNTPTPTSINKEKAQNIEHRNSRVNPAEVIFVFV